jgi:predicted Zn-dependent protease
MEYAEQAAKVAPNSPAILDTLGGILVRRGQAGKGVEYLERAVNLAPGRNDIRLNYAKGLVKAGRKDAARKELDVLQAVKDDFPGKAEIAGLLNGL